MIRRYLPVDKKLPQYVLLSRRIHTVHTLFHSIGYVLDFSKKVKGKFDRKTAAVCTWCVRVEFQTGGGARA